MPNIPWTNGGNVQYLYWNNFADSLFCHVILNPKIYFSLYRQTSLYCQNVHVTKLNKCLWWIKVLVYFSRFLSDQYDSKKMYLKMEKTSYGKITGVLLTIKEKTSRVARWCKIEDRKFAIILKHQHTGL